MKLEGNVPISESNLLRNQVVEQIIHHGGNRAVKYAINCGENRAVKHATKCGEIRAEKQRLSSLAFCAAQAGRMSQ